MGYQTLIVERTGAVATITLHRPEARNALDITMRQELLLALDEIERDDGARVLVLTGAGGNFCAGGDVKSMRDGTYTAATARERVDMLNRFIVRFVAFPRPTIAMVDGFAVGAGCNLALCCDLVVAADRARFGEVFAKIGLVPDGGGTYLLSRVVGLARAKELIFTGDVFDAAEAARLGLVNHVVPLAELQDHALALAEKIAQRPLFALKLTKEAVNAAQDAQGRGQAMSTSFALHQLCHSHWQGLYGIPMNPDFQMDTARNRAAAAG